MKINVGVIFGGETVEHEVSIISALQAISNMDKEKYEVVPIYISKERNWYTSEELLDIETYKDLNNIPNICKNVVLTKENNKFFLVELNKIFKKKIEIDVVFPIVHGNNVEDGSLAGYLETINIPYVGSSMLGASIGQDKVVMKQVFASSDIPVVDYTWFYDSEYLNDKDSITKKINSLGYPVIVKPASLGSSVGISCAKNEEELDEKIMDAIKYDNKIVVEKGVENLIEVNCSVYGDYEEMHASAIEEVTSSNDILTYTDKYIGDKKGTKSKGMASASRKIPADIGKEMTKKIEDLSKKVYRVLNLGGVCRIDYLIDSKTNEVFVNEPNTIPGSLSFYLWESAGLKYSDLLDKLIKIAIKNYKNKNKKTRSFDTNILSNYNGTKGIKK